MRRTLSALSLALLAFTPACDTGESDADMGDAFRSTLDVNIQLEQADGGEEDGTILWEILEAEVYEGLAVDDKLSLYIKDDAIYTAGGVETCSINAPLLNSSVREVIAANGTDVLFTVWGAYVFDGEVDPKHNNFGQIKRLFGSQLLFEFDRDEVYLGEASDGFRLLRANAGVENSSDGRKLLIAALITGECGASGMPGYTF